MANTSNSDKWYFTKEQLENTPSRKCGIDSYKELSYRQQAANFIQDMGQRLKVNQLCINTAIVYMHRFYVFHSFTNFPWHQMAAAALFLAAKVEEQPRKLEYVIRVANICRNPRDTNFDINSERYIAQSQDLVFNENVLLQTLGFDVAIDHPHTHVVRCCHLVRASRDLARTSYFMASNSLHLTTMCIQYKPTVVACFCISVACKWSNWEIPLSNEKKEWYSYVDSTVTAELLQQLTEEFLTIFENCPSRLKEKMMAISESNTSHTPNSHPNSPFDTDPKKVIREDVKDSHAHRLHESKLALEEIHKHRSRAHESSSGSQQSREQREREYKERKERERIAQQKALMSGKPLPHAHHRPSVDPKTKPHSKPLPPVGGGGGGGYPPNNRPEPRDILREASRDSPFGLAAREHGKDPNSRESQSVRSDKDAIKRDYLLKHNVPSDTNSLSNYPDSRSSYGAEKRADQNRCRSDPNKPASKHESLRRQHDDPKYLKTETDNIKKHLSASLHDKNSAYLNKSSNSTSQKILSDASKSVPKTNCVNPANKTQHNGSLPLLDSDLKVKPEPQQYKEEIPVPAVIKRPSLFSPETTPTYKKTATKTEVVSAQSHGYTSGMLSPIDSPGSKRSRNYSSSSEPELRPVMKKIDQVEETYTEGRTETVGYGYGNDGKQLENVSNPIPDTKPIVNGLETNPTLISNLLKQTPSLPHLPTVSAAAVDPPTHQEQKDHHHHKSKKKKEKHKHKDKEKNREDKEKKKKHKDKDREKHKHKDKQEPTPEASVSEPIKIKIQKDKIQSLPENPATTSGGLKIKIPKDRIKTENIGEPTQLPPPMHLPTVTGGLKIKISKDVLNNCNSSTENRKRERDRGSPSEAPPNKLSKSKQNGRHSYNKVSQQPYHKNNARTPVGPPWQPPRPNVFHTGPMYQPVPYYSQMPPPAMPNMSVPPPPYMAYAQYYQGYMYPAEMYHHQPVVPPGSGSNPPLPMDAPPDVPPPPPPE